MDPTSRESTDAVVAFTAFASGKMRPVYEDENGRQYVEVIGELAV